MKRVRLGDVATIDRLSVLPGDIKPDDKYLGLEHIEIGGRIIGQPSAADSGLLSNKFRFTPNHVLMGKLRPNLAKVARPTFEGICSTDILPIRPGRELDRDYLAHFLLQPAIVYLAASQATGANLPRLNPGVLESFELPLPPIVEQRRIATILDHADALRTKRLRALSILEQLVGSTFNSMFGSGNSFPDVALRDVAEVSSGLTKGRKLTGQDTRSVPYLAVANVQAGHLSLVDVKTIEATAAEIERTRLQGGDLVVTEGGDPDKLGRGTIWRDELPLCLHQNHIFRVRVDRERVLPEYLESFIGSAKARAYFLRSAKQTTGIASINMQQLRSLMVPVPDLSLQREFLRRRGQVLELMKNLAPTNFDRLFASLQARAFRGEL